MRRGELANLILELGSRAGLEEGDHLVLPNDRGRLDRHDRWPHPLHRGTLDLVLLEETLPERPGGAIGEGHGRRPEADGVRS
jgi:hypothetical protein